MKSTQWLENKGATINLKYKKDNKRFQHSVTFALHYNEIKKKELKKLFKKIKHEDIKFPSHQRDWENFEQNNG